MCLCVSACVYVSVYMYTHVYAHILVYMVTRVSNYVCGHFIAIVSHRWIVIYLIRCVLAYCEPAGVVTS